MRCVTYLLVELADVVVGAVLERHFGGVLNWLLWQGLANELGDRQMGVDQ